MRILSRRPRVGSALLSKGLTAGWGTSKRLSDYQVFFFLILLLSIFFLTFLLEQKIENMYVFFARLMTSGHTGSSLEFFQNKVT